MKTIGVISDTHLRRESTCAIPQQVWDTFQNVDLILHGGDLTVPDVLETLRNVAPVIAVRGNNDFGELRELPLSLRVEIEGVVIGLAHGDVPAFGQKVRKLENAPGNRQTAANAISHFEYDDDVRCIIFGHSHRPLLQEYEIEDRKVLLLNTGSPTDRRYAPHFGCALLKIDGQHIEPELITW
jgi:putative phosphoesterase